MPINSRLGKKMDLEIERLGINGEGVGSWYGCTLFVDGALPGETVHASLYEKKKSYGRARILKILSASPERVDPICPLFGQCGGCQIMHLSYPEQLKAKRQRVLDALERIGKFKGIEVSDCWASEPALQYRNKIQIPIDRAPTGGIRFGLYARNTHDLVEIKECFIHCELGETVFQKIQTILHASSLQAYSSQDGQGELKHLLIKTAVGTQQVLVVFVSALEPSALLQKMAEEILLQIPAVKGVVHNFNPEGDNTVLGDVYTTLAGQDSIEELLSGLVFKVSPASFFQVNPSQAQKLYKEVVESASIMSTDVVLDAYCGVGTMSLLMAKKAHKVIGVECVSQAIDDARDNAERNSLMNVEFHVDVVEHFVDKCSETIDIAVLNPPRKGCDLNVIEKIGSMPLKKIVYISCDPATLARDLQLLSLKGWHINRVQPFDMFPQTAHVETLVVLSK
ncbi:MAG: 23S rRNA (uracil(1939)-C(5))-methyltransferase RlmD [Chlamydiae bacterium]|nr:23S rRNA (uracil(1939)-C(5))-methyltransferase RlmD [Chlamydiota bacterium]